MNRSPLVFALLWCALSTACQQPVAVQDEAQTSSPKQLSGERNGSVAHLRGWHWQDIMRNMSALRDMGFTALLISPHTATCGGDFSDGYDPSELESFTSRFGTENDLWWLVNTAHQFGFQIYADMVMNHMCAGKYEYTRFGWNDFHHYGSVQDWNDGWWRENGDLFGLADLAHESSYVRSELWNFLVKTNNFGFDGYRFDAAKHVPQWYWKDHVVGPVNSWGKLSIGEVYDADFSMLQSYVDIGMMVTDYNLYDATSSAFRFGGNLSSLDGAGYAARNGSRAITFIENHDVGPPPNRRLAQAFLAAYVGYPIFYGVNLGDGELKNLVWVHSYLAKGAYISRDSEASVLIFERDGHLLTGINQTGEWQTRWVSTNFWSGTQLHDYSGHTQDVWVQGDGRVQVSIPPMDYVMLAPSTF